MTREEAKQAIAEGKKVTHPYLRDDEYVMKATDGSGMIETEDGFMIITPFIFWSDRRSPALHTLVFINAKGFDNDWSIFEDHNK